MVLLEIWVLFTLLDPKLIRRAPRVAVSVAPTECPQEPIGRPRNPGGQCEFWKNTQNCGEEGVDGWRAKGEGGKEAGTDATTRNQKRRKMQKVNGGWLARFANPLPDPSDGRTVCKRGMQTNASRPDDEQQGASCDVSLYLSTWVSLANC